MNVRLKSLLRYVSFWGGILLLGIGLGLLITELGNIFKSPEVFYNENIEKKIEEINIQVEEYRKSLEHLTTVDELKTEIVKNYHMVSETNFEISLLRVYIFIFSVISAFIISGMLLLLFSQIISVKQGGDPSGKK